MRVAVTIVLNATEHFKHNDYIEKLLPHFDAWVFVEGASASGGSTSWCKEMSDKWQKDGHSVDGTVAIIDKMLENENVYCVRHSGFWKSKEEMVNAGLATLSIRVPEGRHNLWTFDIDEQFTIEDIKAAETALAENDGKCGMFLANYYVGKNLLAHGEWGEGKKLPYRRLWNWNSNERFKTHEPPELEGGNGKMVLLPQRFNHYAYYFEKDVAFKDEWYGGHEGILVRWRNLQVGDFASIHVMALLGTGYWGTTQTYIRPIKSTALLDAAKEVVGKVEVTLKDEMSPQIDKVKKVFERKNILVVSHERSGTHFLINSLVMNIASGIPYSNEVITLQQAERSFQIDKPSVTPIKEQIEAWYDRPEGRILKSHHQYQFFGLDIDEIIKHFHVIYIVRDGRDVMTSCLHYFNQAPAEEFPRCESMTEFLESNPSDHSFDKEYSIDPDNSFPARWANHVAGWMAGHDKITIVRYEDLSLRFEPTMRVLETQLGLKMRDELVRPGLDAKSIFPRKGVVGDWRHTFTRFDRDVFDKQAGNVMKFLKYYIPDNRTSIDNLKINKHTVAINIIVGGGEQKELRMVLSSLQSHLFDEVVIVVTTKDSKVWAVAQEFTEKAIAFKWINDFGAARNCAIEHTESDYIFWCDADDIVPQECQSGMQETLDVIRMHDFDYYTMTYIIERLEGKVSRMISRRPVVFRNCEAIRWKYAIHEALTLENFSNQSSFNGMKLEHQPAKGKESGPRNLAILERVQDQDSRMMFYYGRELVLSGYVKEGLKKLRQLVEHGAATPEELACSCFEIGSRAFDGERLEEAEYYANLGLKHMKTYAELHVLYGDVKSKQGLPDEAAACYKRAALQDPVGALCQDVRYYEFLPADRLSHLHYARKDYSKALWYNSVAEACGFDLKRLEKNKQRIIEAMNERVLEK